MMDFRRIKVFSMKKADNSANFECGCIMNHRTQHLLYRDKKNR
jgi:hypothetical protein